MGTVFYYYDKRHHAAFDMGKSWAIAWNNPIDKLFLPRQDLIAALLDHFRETYWELPNHEEYAAWLADQLIQFRSDASFQDIAWINDLDDSFNVMRQCGICGHCLPARAYGSELLCACENPKPAIVRTRYREP